MATVSKFYLHDAATPNTGTMPTGAFLISGDSTGDAPSARTALDATDVIGTLQTSRTFTSTANTSVQNWGFGRWVSRPLAAQTIAFNTPSSWTFSFASSENNLLHNQTPELTVYCWRPSTGAAVGTPSFGNNAGGYQGTEPTVAATQQAQSGAFNLSAGLGTAILDGDILVFEVYDFFTQGMAVAYTSTFFYDGTTEASTTSCASFVTPPAALALQDISVLSFPYQFDPIPFVSPGRI